ncbi:MAG TPA: HAMP domain-containing sensor histidine kinase [Candidatus Acidoferrales bacterium]|nr:HAMP domain-containing sensor histidine kinase [Candidatus Acidoferrales bacterium]
MSLHEDRITQRAGDGVAHALLKRVNTARASLVVRIAVGVVVLDLALTALLVALGVFVARTELMSSFDNSLQSKAISLRALVRYDEDATGDLIFDSSGLPSSADASHPDAFAIYLSNGQLFAQSPGWSGLPARTRYLNGGFVRYFASGAPFRGLILRDIEILDREDGVAPAKITVVYAASMLGLRHRVFLVGLYLSAAGLAVLGVVAWLTIGSVRRSVGPLRALAGQADRINAKNWVFEAPKSARETPELAPLTTALETVVARLHDSFANQRQFTSDLAHELKTHVAIIKSSLQVLHRQPRSAEEYRAGVGDLLGDCERLESVVERMLRLARVEQLAEERRGPDAPPADVLTTCEAAVARVESLANSKGVTIELQGEQNGEVSAEADDLELVWLNLLENAVRHSSAGKRVVIRLSDKPGNIEVKVEDSGSGIAAEDLARIFERFRRGSGDGTTAAQGFGLGLAICKAIVERYGGSIELTSAVGQGTQVRVLLPRTSENVESATKLPESDSGHSVTLAQAPAEPAR